MSPDNEARTKPQATRWRALANPRKRRATKDPMAYNPIHPFPP